MASSPKTSSNPMWGGHFAEGPAEAFAQINVSIGFDKRLYAQDIAGSIAHCQMLEQQKILTKEESKAIQGGLKHVLAEIESGQFTFKTELEDIHMNVEARLAELVGDVAGKLHTARSRNDQVATDFRLYVREACDTIHAHLHVLQSALIHQAERYAETVMPGFTHWQIAQPITFGHHLLAYVEMFGRDRERFSGARQRANESPLGAAALAGTTYPINRQTTASALGFERPLANSLDAVGDRDFALEFLASCAITAVHLSRLAEELVFWCSPLVGFVKLPEAFTSGSSITPQKRNPDAAELIRGKTGRIIGSLNALLITLKALPLAYNKDLQEDKEPVFDAADQLTLCVLAMRGMIEGLEANEDRMRAAAEMGYATATDLADWLVQELGIPFRQAHHITGQIVRLAESAKLPLSALSLEDMRRIEPRITQDMFNAITVEQSVARRQSLGGTAPSAVRQAIAIARKRYL